MTKRLTSRFIGTQKGATRVNGIMSDPKKLIEIVYNILQDLKPKYDEFTEAHRRAISSYYSKLK